MIPQDLILNQISDLFRVALLLKGPKYCLGEDVTSLGLIGHYVSFVLFRIVALRYKIEVSLLLFVLRGRVRKKWSREKISLTY